jgi:NitT/TauT family transport system ATP-binding protein
MTAKAVNPHPLSTSNATSVSLARPAGGEISSGGRPLIQAANLGRTYEWPCGRITALESFNLTIMPGEFRVIVGPSGCGKTTFLRMLAGLEKPTSGVLEMSTADGRKPSNAMVFQGRSVFPWLTVEQNVGYGLKLRGLRRRERKEQTDELLATVGLTKFAASYAHQLSEGMKQRVAIARALAVDPDLLLMDEPFGALDEQTRFLLQEEVLRIWERTRKTVVFITHSIDEALTMADRIAIMSAHPGTLLANIEVPFARPRELSAVRSDPAFAELFNQIWELLKHEVLRACDAQEGMPA